MSVSYSISGSVSYEVNDVFVDIETSLYMSSASSLTNRETLNSTISAFDTQLGQSELNIENIVQHTAYGTSEYSSYTQEGGFDNTENPTSKSLPIKYGSYIANDSAYAYYVVIKITNKAENDINAALDLDLDNVTEDMMNSIVDLNQSNTTIQGNTTQYFVVGMALDNATVGVADQQFNWSLKVTTEDIVPYFVDGPQLAKPQGLFMALGNSEDYVDISNSGIDEEILPENKTNISVDMGNGSQSFHISKSEIKVSPDLDYSSATIDVASDNEIMAMIVLDGVDYTVDDVLSIAMNVFMTPNYTNENLICSVMSPDSMTISFLEIPQSNTFTVGIAGLSELNSIHYSSTYSTSYNSVFDVNLTQTLTFSQYYVDDKDVVDTSEIWYSYQNFTIENVPSNVRYLAVSGDNNFRLETDESGTLSSVSGYMYIFPGKIIDELYTFKNFTYNIHDLSFWWDFLFLGAMATYSCNNEVYLDLFNATNAQIEFCVIYIIIGSSHGGQQIQANGGQLTFSNTFSFSKDTSEILYHLKDDDTYEVERLKTFVFKDDEISSLHNHMVEIPKEYNGKSVTSIGSQAFSSWDATFPSPTSIVLPETITSIGSQAFFATGVDSIYIKGQNVIDAIFVDNGSSVDNIAGGMLSYSGVPNIYIEKDVILNQFLIDNLQDSGEEVTLNGVVYKLYKNKNMQY